MLITTLDYSDYVGRIGIGRVFAGKIRKGQRVAVIKRDGRRVDEHGRPAATCSTAWAAPRPSEVDRRATSAPSSAWRTVDIGDTLADLENPVAAAAHPRSTSRRCT